MAHTGPARIELRLRELAQLFNSLDPSPFIDRDLDADAEEFIVGWARESTATEFELVLHLATPPPPDRAQGVEAAVQHYFQTRAELRASDLRQMFRRGRFSLAVGLMFLVACFALSAAAREWIPLGPWHEFLDMGLQIVGWVAMWRPLEIYLYDWWPIRKDRTLYERLARMRVRLVLPAAS